MSKPKSEFDTPWKDILNVYFEQFVAYCWPKKYLEIDWSRGYKMLDKELSKLTREAETGNRILDKLVEVYLKNGRKALVFLHLEVQGNYEAKFGERMFIYRARIFDTHRKPIASLAILTDRNSKWRPNRYRAELWDSSVEMRFPTIKLIDYRSRIEELEASTNPFAQVILAHLAALENKSMTTKLAAKIKLTRRLYVRGWKKQDILNLYRFVDWVVALPAPLELKYHQAVQKIEGEFRVAYVTTAERIGIQKGIQQGLKQGVSQGLQQGVHKGESLLLLGQLRHKFGTVPKTYREKMKRANARMLLKWGKRVLDSEALEEVFEA